MQKFNRHITGRPQFWWKDQGQYCWTCLHELRVDFTTTEAAELDWQGMINFVHRYVSQKTDPIGWGVKATLRYDATSHANMPAIPGSSINLAYWQSAEPNVVYGSKAAGNISSYADHYGAAVLGGNRDLPNAGCYRLEWWGNSHSTAWPDGTNGLVEANQNLLANGTVDLTSANADPYSYIFVKVT